MGEGSAGVGSLGSTGASPSEPEGSVQITKGHAAGTFRVWLEGPFPTGWAGALSLGLARARIGIRSGTARRTAARHWTAAFIVQAETETADPETVPYVSLAHRRQPLGTAAPIVVRDFAVEEDAGGALLLEVRGLDRTGFLGSLLDRFAGLALFPEDMNIETEGEVADDRFALRAVGGKSPSPEAKAALVRMLEDLRELP